MSVLIPRHGGYRKLKSFQIARLVYDITVRFCDKYIDRFSRTKDQMVQAARSGVQNIAEGSQASATSRKTEIRLTQVARASLEELKLDYEDFLRQKNLLTMMPDHPVLMRFKKLKPETLDEFAKWVADERVRSVDRQRQIRTDRGRTVNSVAVSAGPCKSFSSACIAANGALSLLNLSTYLLDCQVERLAQNFEKEGGFSERMYRVRSAERRKNKW